MNDATVSNSARPAAPVLLCVDDEPGVLSALRRLLRRAGYQVRLAESAAEGLQILARKPVDLVISDMRMPGMDGAAFLKEVRARWPATIRILLTGYASPASMQAVVAEDGIHCCLAKPWSDEDLLQRVREALDTGRRP